MRKVGFYFKFLTLKGFYTEGPKVTRRERRVTCINQTLIL